MKRTLLVLVSLFFLVPSVSSASSLTYQQASSIVILLQAFNVDQPTIDLVWGYIKPGDTSIAPPVIATSQNQWPVYHAPGVSATPIVNPPLMVHPSPMPIPLVTRLTASMNADFGNQTIAVGTKKAKIASFTLTTDTDAVRLNDLVISISGSDQSSQLYNYIQNLKVVKETPSDMNGRQYGSALTSPFWGDDSFNSSESFRLTESTTNTFDVYADINRDISNILSITLGVVSGNSDSTGVSLKDGNIPLQTITIQ